MLKLIGCTGHPFRYKELDREMRNGSANRGNSWSVEEWMAFDESVREASMSAPDNAINRGARLVLRSFSGSFFLVTRFLPAAKRERVEMIYAAVRYPDEIVDSFPLGAAEKHSMLDRWERDFLQALWLPDIRSRLNAKIPAILAGFAQVVRDSGIPFEYYLSFLAAMRRDIEPQPFRDMQELIDRYVYGSAIVVGYFLAHVYGPSPGTSLKEARSAAANLGIALQLTNFCRDVAEDRARGRLYIPLDLVERHSLDAAVVRVAEDAELRYRQAIECTDSFAPDTRPAIRACIDVYRSLNSRILRSGGDTRRRHSVPICEKFRALPADKYWRVPLAYMGAL